MVDDLIFRTIIQNQQWESGRTFWLLTTIQKRKKQRDKNKIKENNQSQFLESFEPFPQI